MAPIEPSLTEVEGQTVVQPPSVATPISAIAVEALRAAGADADRPLLTQAQELVGVATVVVPDIGADNGVIHGIDLVLLPPDVLRSF